MEDVGIQFADARGNVADLFLENEANGHLYAALQSLLPQQQDLIQQVFFEEKLLTVSNDEIILYVDKIVKREYWYQMILKSLTVFCRSVILMTRSHNEGK